MTNRRWTCVVVLTCFTTIASGQPRPARSLATQKLQSGTELFEQGQYEEAIQQLQEGYAIEPRPEFLYALGQSERKRGNCVRALEHYNAFLATHPPERQAEAAQVHVERCERVLAEQQKSAPPPPAPAPIVPAPTLPTTADLPASPWYKDWVGNGLLAAGVVSAGVGLVFLLRGNGALDGKQRYFDYVAAAEDGKSQQTIGTVLLIAGGGLVAGGILRYLLQDRGPAKTAFSPAPIGLGRGLALSLSGAF